MASAGVRAAWLGFALAAASLPAMAAPEPITLGLSLDLGSSTEDPVARAVRAATEALVEQVNGAGGLRGRPLRLVVLSNGGDPRLASAQVRALAREHRAAAVLSCVGDEVCQAMAQAAGEVRVPLVGTLAGSSALDRGATRPEVFRVRPDYAHEAQALGRQLRALGAARVALVTDTPTGERSIAYRDGLVAQGVAPEILALADDSRAAIEQVLKRLGEGAYATAILDLQLRTLARLAEERLDARAEWPLMLVPISPAGQWVTMGSFPRRTIGYVAVVPDPENPTLQVTRDLQLAAERAGGGIAITPAGLEAYLNGRLLVEALKRTGRDDTQAITAQLDGMRGVDLGGFNVSFAPGRASGSSWLEVRLRPRLRP